MDEELLNCLQRSVAILEVFDDLGEGVLKRLGSWLTLGDILGAVVNHSTS